ncbi:MAG: HEAT repeat domain-containing protein [Myxococcales bacterium]|nr:HEAT repeat domain-containing protein [Myxococcales bacterium]
MMVQPLIARADVIADLAGQLEHSDYKVRLAAVLSLSKLNDLRASTALVTALGDRDKSVRSAAATGLGKLLRLGLADAAKVGAIAALTERKSDPDAGVRKQVERALAAVPVAQGAGGGSVFIDIGEMTTGPEHKAMRPAMDKSVRAAFGKTASTWELGAVGAKPVKLSKSQRGFHVGGSVVELKSQQSGKTATVTCKVSMFIATYPEKSMFGFLNGSASVQADAGDTAAASADCVVAVMEDLVTRKVIPTIKTRSGQ